MNQAPPRPGWHTAGLSVAVLLLLSLGLYRETSLFLVRLWNQWEIGEYAHGYLVLAIGLYLVYRKRETLASLTPCPSLMALFAVAASSLLWLAATVVDVLMVQSAALLLLIMSVIWAALGNQVARQLLLPVFFIGFALPVWSPLSSFLQELTADVVFWITRGFSVPALRQEHLIILPRGQLSIEEACSGLRYLLAALTLGTLYAYLNYQRFWSRVLVVVIAALAAILANIVRVFIVVYLAYATDMQHPLVKDHLSLGWFLFGGLVFVLLVLDVRLSRQSGGPDPGDRTGDKETAAVICRYGHFQRVLVLATTIGLIASGPAIAWWAHRQADVPQEIILELPAGAGGWSGPEITEDRWMPVYHGAITETRAYRKHGRELYLYVGHYPVQSQGRELINALNRISHQKIWRPVYPHGRVTKAGDQGVLEQLLESASGRQRLVWYRYRVAGWYTTNKYVAKGLQVLGLVTGRPQASVIAVSAGIEDDASETRKLLREFMSVMGQPLTRLVDGDLYQEPVRK